MWQAYMDFMERNKRRPSKYYSEDKALYNWCKHSRKLMNNGKLPSERVQLFRILMDTAKNLQAPKSVFLRQWGEYRGGQCLFGCGDK